ncbi:peptide chain release factor N(5)-glutamine methyltransferase [Pedobacter sp. UYP30]|uniref:peptide chain release factor N(5)-glutamine methyltransferase n=1 Tax=Pedobacter sp. UYP30 TaxID=1756400 RepID=UPI00339702A6
MNKTQLNQLFQQELDLLYTTSEVKILLSLTLEKHSKELDIKLVNENYIELSVSLIDRCKKVLPELKNHQPIQYILNQAHFFGLVFQVNEHVLIPRPETEELVFWVLKDLKAKSLENVKLLDIGTGSGCIAISLKKNLPSVQMSAIDVSDKALEVATLNALINKVDVNFIKDDILNSKSNLECDVIVSNPPYVRRLEIKEMQKNVLDFEPHLALFVEDDDSLLFYRAIAEFASKNLSKNGILFLEINEFLAKQTVDLLKDKLFKDIEVQKDMQGKDRMIRARKS